MGGQTGSTRATLRTVAWLSHGRPETLKRSVTSFVSGMGEEARRYRYVISESASAQVKPDYVPSDEFLYVDDEFRTKLISRLETVLKAEGFPEGIARFALDCSHAEGSEGSHRNVIALLTQGEPFVCTDDDVIYDLKQLPRFEYRQTRIGQHNFLPFSDFASLEELEKVAASVSIRDFLRLHETALQTATFSSPGIRGDSAYGGARFIFTFDDSTLEAFCQRSDFVREALGSRVMWRETVMSHIVPYAPIATYMLGIDGRQNLAPCFPFHRNVDGAFVYATKALNPTAQTAQLQASVLHRPPVDRGQYPSLDSLDFRINDLLWLMWSEWLPSISPNTSPESRIEIASQYFQRVGEFDSSQAREYLTDLACRSLLDRAGRLESQIARLQKKDDVPGLVNWLELASKEVELCREKAHERSLPLPVESDRSGRDDEARLRLTQDWIHSYGWLLAAWPKMKSTINEPWREMT